jgi:hypothetical protein
MLLCTLLVTSSLWHPSLAETSDAAGAACPLDIYILIDLTGSFGGEVEALKANAPTIVSTILTENPNTRFGLGWFQDYPVWPYGEPPMLPYGRAVDLTFDNQALYAGIAGLTLSYAGDIAESQVPALYQAVTGSGDGVYIPPGLQANFRSEAAKVIILWTDAPFHRIDYLIPGVSTPTYEQTVAALLALPRAQVLGISSEGGGLVDLQDITADTGSLAPAGGVDCNKDGTPDILAGNPLVCIVGSIGEGITEAFTALVQSVVDCRTPLPIVFKAP